MINALVLGSTQALFIMLRMNLKGPQGNFNISGDMKSLMFVHRH